MLPRSFQQVPTWLENFDEDGVWYVPGSTANGEVSYVIFGNSAPWPTDSEIPLVQVKAAVNHFREHAGERWVGAEWKPWPEEVPL
ncbi:hypothetical protein GCM10029976_055320 [Kribbella albertanoniae]